MFGAAREDPKVSLCQDGQSTESLADEIYQRPALVHPLRVPARPAAILRRVVSVRINTIQRVAGEWLAYTEEDKQRLKLDRIANDEA